MTKRLETGVPLEDKEIPLFLMMLHAFNSREMLNYQDVFAHMEDRLAKMEAHINNQANLKQVMDGSRRVPHQNVGPPNQGPYSNRNM